MSDLLTALRLIISGDPSGAVAAIDQVAMSTDTLGKKTDELAAKQAAAAKAGHQGLLLMAGGAALVTAAVGLSVDAYAKEAEAIINVQKMTGANATWSSEFVAQASAMGISADSVGTFLGRMAKNVEGFEQGTSKSTSTIGQAFKDLGLNVDALKGKNAGVIIDEIRQKLSQMPAGFERDYVMQSLFGRGAAGNPDLMRFLTATQSQLDKINATAKQFGLVFSQKQLDQAAQYGAEMRMLKLEFEGIAVSLGRSFAPALATIGKLLEGVLYVFNLLPGPLKVFLALLPGVLLMAVGFVKVVEAVKTLREGLTMLQTVQALLRGQIQANTIATETNTAAEGENAMAVGEETMTLDARTEALLSDTVATEANSASMLASLGPYALVAAAIAADIVLIMKAVQAYEQMTQAIQQANQAYNQEQQNQSYALQQTAAKYGTNSTQYQTLKTQIAQDNTSANKDKYSAPGMKLWKWFGSGGSFVANSPTVIGVGESGPEQVSVTPVASGGGGSRSVVVQVTGPIYGAIDRATAQRWAAPLGEALGDALYNTVTGAGH